MKASAYQELFRYTKDSKVNLNLFKDFGLCNKPNQDYSGFQVVGIFARRFTFK